MEIRLDRREVLRDGKRYSVRGRPKWFDLIALLAYRRWAGASHGYVDVAEILSLASWRGTTQPGNVGTEIWRRMRTDEARRGGSLIESAKPSTGPYRLAAEPGEIDFGGDPHVVAEYLGALVPPEWARATAERLRDFADRLGRGDVQFRRGNLEEALASYEAAVRLVPEGDIDRRVAALAKVARTQQHLSREAAASDTVARLRALLESERHDDELSHLTLLKHESWVHLRHDHLGPAEEAARRGLSRVLHAGHPHPVLAGDFHNVLGQVARRRGQWPEARSRYVEALRHWSVADYHYGVQAAFFNLGQLERLEGDARALGRRGSETPTPFAREAYRRAERWLLREIAFCEFADVGGNESADLIELALVHARLGDLAAARARLDEAERRTRRTDNGRDRAGIRIVRDVLARYERSGRDFRTLLSRGLGRTAGGHAREGAGGRSAPRR